MPIYRATPLDFPRSVLYTYSTSVGDNMKKSGKEDRPLFAPGNPKEISKREPSQGIQARFPVSEVPKLLQKNHINLGYTGLMYYRSLGLIPPPEKEKGYKERFYNILDLRERIVAIKLISSIFGFNYKTIATYAKHLPAATFNKMPLGFMRIYADIQIKYDKTTPESEKIRMTGPFDLSMFEGVKWAFLNAIRATMGKAKGVSAEEYYLNTVKRATLNRWVDKT